MPLHANICSLITSFGVYKFSFLVQWEKSSLCWALTSASKSGWMSEVEIWTTVHCDACQSVPFQSQRVHALIYLREQLPVVVPLIDLIAASSSVILKSGVIPRTNTSNWAVLQTSQLSSKAKEKKSKRATSHCSWSSRFAMSSILLVTVRLDSGTCSNATFFQGILVLQSPPSTLWQTPPLRTAYCI